MFVAAIAAGMAMTACGGSEADAEAKADELLEELNLDEAEEEEVEEEAEAEGMFDGLMDEAKEQMDAAVEDGKKMATDAIKEKAPEMIEEVKKEVGM